MNLAGYDVVTPGNHDFDWGVPELERALADAAFPYVSANLIPSRATRRWCAPSGSCAEAPSASASPASPRRARWCGTVTSSRAGSGWSASRRRPRAHSRRCDASAELVVALSHSGISGGSTYDTTGVGTEHAAAASRTLPARPDVVMVGTLARRDPRFGDRRRPLRAAPTLRGRGRRGARGSGAAGRTALGYQGIRSTSCPPAT